MLTLLLSIIQAIILCFIIRDKDVKYSLIALAGVFLINLMSYGMPLYYIRMAGLDVLFCLTALLLKDIHKRILLFTIYLTSYSLNLYEHFSYYQTIFYPYRKEIQWCMIQLMYIILLHNCKWRKLCNMQNK